jgi:hypothetical protein
MRSRFRVSPLKRWLVTAVVGLALVAGLASPVGAGCAFIITQNADRSVGCDYVVCADSSGNITSFTFLGCYPQTLARANGTKKGVHYGQSRVR